jgi:hypothetical protein
MNVVGNHPGEGSDIAIPGPDGLVGVAIPAGALEDGLHICGHGQGSVNGTGFVYTGIVPIHWDKLDGHKKRYYCKKDFLHPATHARFSSQKVTELTPSLNAAISHSR